ncbi:MAG: ribonuclease P protein component [Candidatus Nanopelagicales bacterium]
MLPGPRRIRRASQFRAVMRTGSRAATGTVVVHALVGVEGQPARAGFVVGRSVGGSVVRNRVTRQLRHLIGARLTDLPAGTDLVVRAQPPAAHASGAQLARDVDSGLRRALTRLGQQPRTPAGVSR